MFFVEQRLSLLNKKENTMLQNTFSDADAPAFAKLLGCCASCGDLRRCIVLNARLEAALARNGISRGSSVSSKPGLSATKIEGNTSDT